MDEPPLAAPTAGPSRDPEHALTNMLAIIVGFVELLIAETPERDPRFRDLLEIRKAAQEAIALTPHLRAAGRSEEP